LTHFNQNVSRSGLLHNISRAWLCAADATPTDQLQDMETIGAAYQRCNLTIGKLVYGLDE
jgi:hypothetical protein